MTKIRNILFPFCFTLAGILCGCSNSGTLQVDTIEITGVSWACNVNTSYAVFGSSTETEEQLEVVLPVSEGDLLYMLRDDFQFYYRYNPEHGPRLSVTFDTLQMLSVSLNEKLNYIELTESSSLESFSMLTDAEVKQLSTIYIDEPVSNDLLLTLKQHETALAGKGLVLDGSPEPENIKELLSICRPEMLVTFNWQSLPEPEESSCLLNLELLWIEGKVSALAKVASCCGNLESLIIAGWEPEPGELLPLSDLNNLRSLTLAESELVSLSGIEFPESLRNLYLVSCDTLSDINALGNLPDLNRLGLSLCSQVKDVEQIYEINNLQSLAFPPNISHNDFRQLTERFPQLEMLELIGCTEIVNLAPLQALSELNTLVLQLEIEQLTMLDSLKQLKTLILTDEVFGDNPEWIKELRESLPTTTIVPGSGLCLGSGWLLLLLPFVLVFRYLIRTKK
ncbi:MAG: hypothetical protein U9R49_07970 [Bacteroidota bacterium]|nr:hypothetical protein [Bacteroidota bacterium]